MSLAAYKAVWKMELSGAKKLVMLAIADYANDNGECWPSYDTLHEMTGSSIRHLKRVIKELSDDGFLQVSQHIGRGNSNHYIIPLKGDTMSPNGTQEKVTFATLKGDICDIKGDMSSIKGDTMSPEPYITVKNRKKNRKGATKKPAAVLMFQQKVHRYPKKSLWVKLDNTIGDDKADLLFWGEVIEAWLLAGWNEMNIGGMLEFYNRRELPGKAKQQRTKSNGHSKQLKQSDVEEKRLHAENVKRVLAERKQASSL